MKFHCLIICLILSAGTLLAQKKSPVDDFTSSVYAITEVMYHDVVNPPAAARFYAYATMAAYQVVEEINPQYLQVTQVINGYNKKNIRSPRKINLPFTATYALLETGRLLIPSGFSLQDREDELYEKAKKENIPYLDSCKAYALSVANSIAAYAKTDGYFKLSTLKRYQPKSTDSTWIPTPPEYMAAVEPNWKTIRPFMMDSAAQFQPIPAISFSKNPSSPFIKITQEVYNVTTHLTDEQKLIARYWDCNPFANFYAGHVSVAIKKISPGGHWMNITGIACKQAKIQLEKTIQIHAWVAMGLHESFISCWTVKYKSERIRPKTAINRYIDEKWNPLIETPPFPEYTSGHSVISTCSAEILSYFLGDKFKFTDNTEVYFGLPERKFDSFRSAANEAAISRLYGGIHFRDAIENGQSQGRVIASFIINNTTKHKPTQ